MTPFSRYAVYWVPARVHILWSAGCAWLGRDPEDASRSFQARESTSAPCRYGFHATLKAPMHLREDVGEDQFLSAVQSIAATTKCFAMPTLEVRKLADFVALRPVAAIPVDHPLQILADRCVIELDTCRAAFGEGAWVRPSMDLDPEQQALTQRYGYHHVLDRWRFHMTLSDSFPSDGSALAVEAQMLEAARDHFAAALEQKLVADELAVFVEAADGKPFRLAHRFLVRG